MRAKQKALNFPPTNTKVSSQVAEPILVNPGAKYDHARQREATTHLVMMHEHAFSVVEEKGFLFMMRCNNPSYEKIN